MHGAKKTYDGKIAGLYDLEETLGRGHFAVVKLARHVFTGEKVAVKVIDKTKLDEISKAHLFQEVRCMKLVQHPNVVRLYEVIDTQTKLYLILELGDGGDLYDYIMKHEAGLKEDMAKEYFRQIVRAISYCHQLHVVHRDLKPENVVFFERLGIVKLTDFGFSNKFCPGQKLDTSCGSLAYSAPEILLGDSYDAPAVDVWSLGVILYMLVAGQAPFQEANDSETLTMIMDCKYTIPTHVSEACKNLIAKMLVREPEYRATLEDIASDPWLGGSSQIEYLPLVSRHQVTDEDHNIIINKMVNGNIATKEEVLEALDRNEYNHITATYFLLAERKLRTYRQKQAENKTKDFDSLTDVTALSEHSLEKPYSTVSDSSSSDALQLQTLKGTLNVSRTPGETSQNKVRKCSIVQEEEDEEEYGPVVVSSQELTPPHSSLNRRGSRSEGKLNIAIQERIVEERRKEKKESPRPSPHSSNVPRIIAKDDTDWPIKRTSPISIHSGVSVSYIPGTVTRKVHTNNIASGQKLSLDSKSILSGCSIKVDSKNASGDSNEKTTNLVSEIECNVQIAQDFKKTVQEVENKIAYSSQESQTSRLPDKNVSVSQDTLELNEKSLTDAATIAIPIRGVSLSGVAGEPKYKTMPNSLSTSNQASKPTFEGGLELTAVAGGSQALKSRTNRKTITGVSYEQRRNKFLKTRTPSCSSSEASDDDSESRKKRAHKISMEKNQRRDSHNNSNGPEDRNGNGSSGGNPASGLGSGDDGMQNQNSSTENQYSEPAENENRSSNGSCKQCNGENFRRSRRRTGETRLRESQSLNRIMEVQESDGNNRSMGNTEVFFERLEKNGSQTEKKFFPQKSSVARKLINFEKGKSGKSLGARFLQTWSNTISSSKLGVQKKKLSGGEGKIYRGDLTRTPEYSPHLTNNQFEEKEKALIEKKENKLKVLSRYFQVSKKICLPIPNLSSSNGRLYKARSCGSISKDKITTSRINTLKHSEMCTTQNKGASGRNIFCSNQRELNIKRKQSTESTLVNGSTNSLKILSNGGRYRSKNDNLSSTRILSKDEDDEGDVNKNVSNAKGYCPHIGVCQTHMREAAKCHLS